MKAWLDVHGRVKEVSTDQWYLSFLNRLLPIIRESYLHWGEDEQLCRRTAVTLALYLEDCIADKGNWREFINWHRKSYGKYLPFYELSDAYLPDEINKEDIAFLLWEAFSTAGEGADTFENPFDGELLKMAGEFYGILDEVFEEAPVSENLASEWLVDKALMEKQRTVVPAATLGEELPEYVEHFLKASGGEPLMFFGSYGALRDFCVQSLQWEEKPGSLLPDLKEFDNFVLYANRKGLLIAPDVVEYFADKRNEFYQAGASEEEAYELFCEQGLCPFDLLKYGMEHGLLPDAQFPFENGKKLLHGNWDFIARWFLREYYEGE